MRGLDRRLAALEKRNSHATHSTAAGLIALLVAGKLTVTDLSDGELNLLVDEHTRSMSDEELQAIVDGV